MNANVKNIDRKSSWIINFPSVAHYTTYPGLMGILQSKQLWATHYKFLNYSSEMEHGAIYINDICSQVTRSTQFNEKIRQFHSKYPEDLKIYV